MTRRCLVIIDVQQGFLDPSWGPHSTPGFAAALASALARARDANVPIVHVRHLSASPGSPLRPGQAGAAFMAAAAPQPGEAVVEKSVHSAFIGTDFAATLARLGARHLVLAGIATDHCVSTTARMAADLGFTVTVLADATRAFDRRDHRGGTLPADVVQTAALASLREEFAAIATVDEAFPLAARREHDAGLQASL